MKDKLNKIFRNWRIVTLIVLLVFSLAVISNIPVRNAERAGESIGAGFGNGLDFGLDFVGGVEMQLRLEDPANGTVTSDIMEMEKNILEKRLNSMGLKDIPVRPWGDRYILIQVASASPEDIDAIENILKQQARFEARIDGDLAIEGSDVSLDLGSQGSAVMGGGPYSWYVSIKLTREGGERFCTVGEGNRNKPIDMFLDRPENTFILMTSGTYAILEDIVEDEEDLSSDSYVTIVEDRALIPIVVLENGSLPSLENLSGYSDVIIAAGEDQVPESVRNELEELGYSTVRDEQSGREYSEWVKDMIGLTSSPRLRCDPCSQCKYNAQISGSALTLEDARNELDETKILLSSGNLPAKAVVESKSEFPSSLGEKFLIYSFLIGIIALVTVACVIYLRYRQLFIVIPTILTGFSEIILILGVAAIINWELDLPAVAGIIAAVGTGVDDQIVITDETIKRGKEDKKKIVSVVERIRRAFFIIFTAAATTIAVMLPVFSIQALKGFALTTIVGVVIGVFITRPAYAKIIEIILKD